MGGTFDEVLEAMVSGLVRSLLQERSGGGVSDTCTLLGPEGPGADGESSGFLLVAVPLGPFPGVTVVARGGGYRPYFENYTVDASIFDMSLRVCVVKMILKIISQFFDDSTHVISSL